MSSDRDRLQALPRKIIQNAQIVSINFSNAQLLHMFVSTLGYIDKAELTFVLGQTCVRHTKVAALDSAVCYRVPAHHTDQQVWWGPF